MKLLLTTQVIDRADPVLGFMHRWIEVFAEHWDDIIVICLREGEHELPRNVRVFSLGKRERSARPSPFRRLLYRLRYTFRFVRLIRRLRNEYDRVFVHQNAEYLALGGIFWRLWGKKTALWYNHPAWRFPVRIASVLAHVIFYTSPHSSTAGLRKAHRMPAGIDTRLFTLDPSARKIPNSILSLGRISTYKRIHVIIHALERLAARGVAFTVSVYGNKIPAEADYFARMRARMGNLEQSENLSYSSGIPHAHTPFLFSGHEVFVNASEAGNFDKAILEAMACGTLVATSNPELKSVVPPECLFNEGDTDGLSRTLENLLAFSPQEKTRMGKLLREYVVKNHTLEELAARVRTKLT